MAGERSDQPSRSVGQQDLAEGMEPGAASRLDINVTDDQGGERDGESAQQGGERFGRDRGGELERSESQGSSQGDALEGDQAAIEVADGLAADDIGESQKCVEQVPG